MPKIIHRNPPIHNADGTITVDLSKGFTTVIDEIDAEFAILKWCPRQGKNGIYVTRTDSRRLAKGLSQSVILHREILAKILGRPLQKNEHVDHKDLNPLNNRRSNIRLATRSQNAANTPLTSRNKSGYKGVNFDKRSKKWVALLQSKGKTILRSVFDDPIEAHRAYCKAALIHFGEFCNFGDNSPFRGWTLADFAAPAVQLALPLESEAA